MTDLTVNWNRARPDIACVAGVEILACLYLFTKSALKISRWIFWPKGFRNFRAKAVAFSFLLNSQPIRPRFPYCCRDSNYAKKRFFLLFEDGTTYYFEYLHHAFKMNWCEISLLSHHISNQGNKPPSADKSCQNRPIIGYTRRNELLLKNITGVSSLSPPIPPPRFFFLLTSLSTRSERLEQATNFLNAASGSRARELLYQWRNVDVIYY